MATILVSVTDRLTNPGGSKAAVGPIAGGVGGAVVLIAVIIIIAVFVRRRKRAEEKSDVYKEKGERTYENYSEGVENTGFNAPHWNQPEAELVVNEFYEPFEGSKVVTAQNKTPKKSPKPASGSPKKAGGKVKKEKGKVQKVKSAGNAHAKPTSASTRADTDYEETGFTDGSAAKKNSDPHKKPGLKYTEVEFSSRSGSVIHPRDAPVTYASIANQEKKSKK